MKYEKGDIRNTKMNNAFNYKSSLYTIIKIMLIAVFLTSALATATIDVLALSTNFETESLSDQEVSTVKHNMNLQLISNEPSKSAIDCFDVNKNGFVAIGCSSSGSKSVLVYSDEGVFRYGYRFDTSGSFGVEWSDDTINIILVRSDCVVSVDATGAVVNISKAKDTKENNSYWNDHIFSDRKTVGNKEYAIENDFGIFNYFASSYSMLTVTEENGDKTIIYDVHIQQLTKILTVFIVVTASVVLAIFVIIRNLRKHR